MTISRKEFQNYAKALGGIRGMAFNLCDASWWRSSYKKALLQDIVDECLKLEDTLKTRVSKPRTKPEPTP